MTKQEIFKTNLYNLLKKDVAIEIYNQQNDTIIFSFFHLDSVYNGLIWYNTKTKIYNIDFQYHDYTKTLENLLRKVMQNIEWFKLDYIEKEINFYRELSTKIFDAKYSTKTLLHTIND